MEYVLNIKSRNNDNVYHVFDEKIVVTFGAKTKDIALPFDSSEYETKGYTLVSQTEIKMDEVDWWTDRKRE